MIPVGGSLGDFDPGLLRCKVMSAPVHVIQQPSDGSFRAYMYAE